jgi:hypothetical protein
MMPFMRRTLRATRVLITPVLLASLFPVTAPCEAQSTTPLAKSADETPAVLGSRLLLSGALAATISPGAALADSTATFTLPSGVIVRIVEAPFTASRFKVRRCADQDQDATCRINGGVPFGAAGGLPKTYVRSITIMWMGQSYRLNVSDMYDAWGSRPLEVKGVIRYFGGQCFDSQNCQFRGIFSDAAGAFVAEWVIRGGLVLRTILSGSVDVIDLFIKHIDPPTFE